VLPSYAFSVDTLKNIFSKCLSSDAAEAIIVFSKEKSAGI